MSEQQNGNAGSGHGETRPFNPNEHLMQIKNRGGAADYLPVQWRLVWFNEKCPEGKITIIEKIIDPDREIEKEVMQWNSETRRSEKIVKRALGWAYFHVRVEDGKGKVGEAVKSESAVDFDDYIEKADTGATGRALAKIGYGTQFAPEFDEQHRIVDAPVERANTLQYVGNGSGKANTNNQPADEKLASAPATEQQLASLRKLCQRTGETEPLHPETMTYQDVKALILNLSKKYNESRQNSKAS